MHCPRRLWIVPFGRATEIEWSHGVKQRVRVKICGITSVNDALAAAQAGADAIGLVFYAPSPRAVTPAQAQAMIAALPPFVTTVGLFVNATAAEVDAVLSQVALDRLQFHGDETPEFCAQFTRPYMKAVRMQAETSLAAVAKAHRHTQGLLVDTYKKGVPGGTGETFHWQWVSPDSRGPLTLPLILAGGLHADNVAQACQVTRPWAVDVSGGVEKSPGVKSLIKMQQFVAAVNSYVDPVDQQIKDPTHDD